MKGRNWVNVNAEQPHTQAETSSSEEGPDPDLGGAKASPSVAAHNTPPGW